MSPDERRTRIGQSVGLHEYAVAKMIYKEVEMGGFSSLNWMRRLAWDNQL